MLMYVQVCLYSICSYSRGSDRVDPNLHSTLCLHGTYGTFPFSGTLPNRLAGFKALGFNVQVKQFLLSIVF
jgi:hypothetical protein